MPPHLLIAALVARAGGSLAVAKAMHKPSFQGTLHKICAGHVANPARASARRIAEHFSIPVDAVYDADVATRVHAPLFGTNACEHPPAPDNRPAKPARARRSTDAQALAQLYDEMTPEERQKLRLMLWVVKPGINPTHFPAPPPDHVDEHDSGLSNLDQPPTDDPAP